jgi:energy-coupling factor transport system substrate-specific component
VEVENASSVDEQAGAYWDGLIRRLQDHRDSVGSPSFRVLAERVAAARVENGVNPYAARVGKTTVYDCFQLGRVRVNLDLVREVARAMGASSVEVDDWIESCRRPRAAMTDPPVPVVRPASPSAHQVVGLMTAALVMNLLGRGFVMFFDFPLHLDMIGTAVVALALGPWRGAAVGASTGILGVALSGTSSLSFAVVNVVGALAWGYGVRRFNGGATIPRFVLLNLATGALCSLAAVPILLGLYDGATRHSFDGVTSAFDVFWSSYAASVLFSNFVTSALDKMLSGFLALTVITSLPLVLRPSWPITTSASRLRD